jgi:hypothetical protein
VIFIIRRLQLFCLQFFIFVIIVFVQSLEVSTIKGKNKENFGHLRYYRWPKYFVIFLIFSPYFWNFKRLVCQKQINLSSVNISVDYCFDTCSMASSPAKCYDPLYLSSPLAVAYGGPLLNYNWSSILGAVSLFPD